VEAALGLPETQDELKQLVEEAEDEIASIKRDLAASREPAPTALPPPRVEPVAAPPAAPAIGETLGERLKLLAAS
jgi:hypothetical protein